MALIVAMVVTLAATPVAIRVARRLGITDRPGPLKLQAVAIPYLGGAAVMAGVTAALIPTRPALLLPLGIAVALGLADDIRGISPKVRLGAEVVIGLSVAAVCPVRGVLGLAVSACLVVVLVNAVNMLDGLDGLASGVGLAGAAGFALSLEDPRVLALSLVGALAAFLLFNRPPAKIYLGDAGSYLIGTTLALLLAHAMGAGRPLALGFGSLLFVAAPVTETAVTFIRRYRAGLPLIPGDRGHIYDQLVRRGRTTFVAAAVCVSAQLVLSAAGALLVRLPAAAAAAGTVAAFLLVAWLVVLQGFTDPKRTWQR